MLTPEELDKVRGTLNSSGWVEVMRPRLENRIRTATKALVLTTAERGEVFRGQDFATTDDVLRAIIRDCEWMIFSWDNEIAVASHNQRRDELDRQVLQ